MIQSRPGATLYTYGSYVPYYDGGFTTMPMPVAMATPYAMTPSPSVSSVPFLTESRPIEANGIHGHRGATRVVPRNGAPFGRTPATGRHHPPRRSSVGEDKKSEDANTPCQFYLRTGTCDFGNRCKYYHPPNQKPPTLNKDGYPLRKGEKNCPYYMKRGVCGFGATCKFHHPALAQSRGRFPAGLNLTIPSQMMPMVSADYGTWTPAIPTQGWYAPPMMTPATMPPMIPGMYPTYTCYPSVRTTNDNIVDHSTTSPAGSYSSSGTNNRVADGDHDTESSAGCSDVDRCWSY